MLKAFPNLDQAIKTVFMSKPKSRILVVDDQSMFRMLISSVLKKSGMAMEILEAEDGASAMKLLDQHHFDLVVTDLNMPSMNGFDLTSRIREHPDNRFSKVCIISGEDNESEQTEARQCGANAFVLKPIDKDELLKTVRRLLH